MKFKEIATAILASFVFSSIYYMILCVVTIELFSFDKETTIESLKKISFIVFVWQAVHLYRFQVKNR